MKERLAGAILSAVDLKRDASEILATMPMPEDGYTDEFTSDLRWLLSQLKDHGAVRINCGGEDHTSPSGAIWGKDRFSAAGDLSNFRNNAENLLGGDDEELYLTARWYPPDPARPSTYRIPLPVGKYRVTLHFTEIWFLDPGRRVFDVALEGERVLESYEPRSVGFAMVDKQALDVEVTDGFLDIELLRRVENPQIAGIEIEMAE